jgi:hypothetical protein
MTLFYAEGCLDKWKTYQVRGDHLSTFYTASWIKFIDKREIVLSAWCASFLSTSYGTGTRLPRLGFRLARSTVTRACREGATWLSLSGRRVAMVFAQAKAWTPWSSKLVLCGVMRTSPVGRVSLSSVRDNVTRQFANSPDDSLITPITHWAGLLLVNDYFLKRAMSLVVP